MSALAQVENNPGYDRPGLGFTPAVLQRGDFMLEQGLPDWSRADGISLYNANTLLRLGIGHSLELQLGTGWNRLKGSGQAADGRADTSLAVKFSPSSAGDVSWGVLGSVEFADGARAFRAERDQYLLGASVNWQRNADHALGLYLEAVHGDNDNQMLAVNSSWELDPALGMYIELAAQHQDGLGHGSMGGAGLTWQITPRVQLDFGVRHRLGGYADTWQGGVGFAVYFGD
ncbi:hypothetical protein GCM10007205_18170 [Oxalicibacterium flavum]|uniref:Uncharacterized protein n=1 Tax=Oxalicibacterium flavum TaxID=179467 RepID=A0A8J2UKW1_9BURK|nr:hypothetical protein [Oxalicibacterium flavum]GGC09391.1 hypothetical protein GCM10007205_18170 [Oxalicibacterium flavum]